MFYPIGDDIEKRAVPIVGIALVSINCLVFAYTSRLYDESFPQRAAVGVSRGGHPRVTAQTIEQSDWGKFMRRWGVVPADLAKGRYESLLTSMFLHIDIYHLIGNMFVLWALCGSLENAMGSVRFGFFYLLWGCVAGLSHALSDTGSHLPMIGASGAIAGMMGAYWLLFGALAKIHFIGWFFFKLVRFSMPAGVVFLIWVALQFAGIEAQKRLGVGGVAYFAHLGGFLVGAITLIPFKRRIARTMAINERGELRFEDQPAHEARANASAKTSPDALLASLSRSCAYCQTLVTKEHEISPNLCRCPNPACQRLVYWN
jgi:membrane associated rhomboid family serine protease